MKPSASVCGRACRDLAEDPKLMERLEAVVRRLGVVGEAANISGAYLVATSRLLEKNALSLLRRGAAAGGKNFLLTNVVTLIPESEVIQLSGVSATALVYFGEDEDALQHKLIVVVEAAILAERSNGDENPALVLLRSLLSEGSIDRMVTVPQRDGPPKAIRVRRKGPVAVMMTSARDNVESEMLTRLLVCDADESPEQSERVLTRKLNQGEAFDAWSPKRRSSAGWTCSAGWRLSGPTASSSRSRTRSMRPISTCSGRHPRNPPATSNPPRH